ncbi:hypothetical protein ACE6H2_006099 [Prunus campanulata]
MPIRPSSSIALSNWVCCRVGTNSGAWAFNGLNETFQDRDGSDVESNGGDSPWAILILFVGGLRVLWMRVGEERGTWILRGWEFWNKIGERAYNQRS